MKSEATIRFQSANLKLTVLGHLLVNVLDFARHNVETVIDNLVEGT